MTVLEAGIILNETNTLVLQSREQLDIMASAISEQIDLQEISGAITSTQAIELRNELNKIQHKKLDTTIWSPEMAMAI